MFICKVIAKQSTHCSNFIKQITIYSFGVVQTDRLFHPRGLFISITYIAIMLILFPLLFKQIVATTPALAPNVATLTPIIATLTPIVATLTSDQSSGKLTYVKTNCPEGPKVVSGDQACNGCSPSNVFGEHEWLFNHHQITGEHGQFILDRGCSSTLNSVEIINTLNNQRSTKKFRVSVTNSLAEDSWTEVVVQGNLPNTMNCHIRDDCDQFESKFYSFDAEVARYVKFEVLEFHLFEGTKSVGGGIRKFDIYFGIYILTFM